MTINTQIPEMAPGSKRHTLTTRLVHGSLATVVILQLLSSLVMHGPDRNSPGDWLFEIHEYSGLLALVFAAGFWLHVLSRHKGTDVRALVPWFSAERRLCLIGDVKVHWVSMKARQVPPYENASPLASAIHGLGLLLMLGMAGTGAVFFFGLYFGIQKTGLFPLDLDVHRLLASLVWAYLVGHAGLAVLHHYLKQSSLSEMWSFRKTE